MTLPKLPPTLPAPASWQVMPSDQLRGDEPVDVRRRSITASAICKAQWQLTASDYAVFIAWWRSELVYGYRKFTADLPSAAGVVEQVLQFVSQPACQAVGHGMMNVDAQLQVYYRLLEAPEKFTGLFEERFNDGLNPYELLSGSWADFSVQSGITGQSLLAQVKSSGPATFISRTLSSQVLCSKLTFKFRIGIINSDDGPLLILYSGSTVRYAFTPVRESGFTSLREPFCRVENTGFSACHNVALIPGVTYRTELTLSSSSNQSRHEIYNEDDGSLVASMTFPGTHPAFTFNRLVFQNDSGGATSSAYYDDILVY